RERRRRAVAHLASRAHCRGARRAGHRRRAGAALGRHRGPRGPARRPRAGAGGPGLISHLRGRLLSLTPELAVVDVHGVGYAVSLPLPTYYELQRLAAQAEVSLFVHTHVREDALALYGFWTERERALFERLITVSG